MQIIIEKGENKMLLDQVNPAYNGFGPDFFYSQYFWYFVFGALILAYVASVIIKRVRRPKSGEKRINAYIEEINKLRVPVQIVNRGRQMTNNTTVPVSFWEVSFRNEETNEVYSFSIKESVCENFKLNQKGVLKFNGGDFISFDRI